MTITLKTEGRRIYLEGDTFRAKDDIKRMGGKWDADARAWWVGSAKQAEAQALVARLANTTPAQRPDDSKLTEEQLDKTEVRARATYKGRSYYVAAFGQQRAKLVANDGFVFWAELSQIEVTRRYGRENYRNRRIEYPTIGGLRRFAERARREDEGGPTKQCWECGCTFTQSTARQNGGDWSTSWCGC